MPSSVGGATAAGAGSFRKQDVVSSEQEGEKNQSPRAKCYNIGCTGRTASSSPHPDSKSINVNYNHFDNCCIDFFFKNTSFFTFLCLKLLNWIPLSFCYD